MTEKTVVDSLIKVRETFVQIHEVLTHQNEVQSALADALRDAVEIVQGIEARVTVLEKKVEAMNDFNL